MRITLFYTSNQINVFVVCLQVMRVFTGIVKIPTISLIDPPPHY